MNLKLLSMIGILSLTCANTHAAETKSEKVKKEASEAIEATKDLALEKKEEFVAHSKKELAELETEIGRLKEKAGAAKEETKEKLELQIDKLEAKRKDMATELEKISKSTGKAWAKMRSGFESAWNELKNAVKKASAEFKD